MRNNTKLKSVTQKKTILMRNNMNLKSVPLKIKTYDEKQYDAKNGILKKNMPYAEKHPNACPNPRRVETNHTFATNYNNKSEYTKTEEG